MGLCDLTRGELGSNGTVEERAAEGQAAKDVLGAAFREALEAGPGCHCRRHARGCCYRGMIESAVILRPCWMKGGIGS